MNPVISPKNYKVKGLTFNRNITLETWTITVYTNEMEDTLSALFLSVGISIRGPPPFLNLWITIKYRKRSVPMHLVTPTQAARNKADDKCFQCSCCKSLECVCEVLAFGIGSRSGSGVIWHMYITVVQSKARRGTTTTKTEAEALHISD